MAPRSTVIPTHGPSQHVEHSHVTVARTFNLAVNEGFRFEIRDRRCSQLCDRFSRNRTNEEIGLIRSRIAAHNGHYGAHLRYNRSGPVHPSCHVEELSAMTKHACLVDITLSAHQSSYTATNGLVTTKYTDGD